MSRKIPQNRADARKRMERFRTELASACAGDARFAGATLVFGAGPVPCPVMFVGEAPGRTETLEGAPFVGRAGRYLTGVVEEVFGRPRGELYITNVVKFWPTIATKRLRTRPPRKEEFEFFMPWLAEEIAIVSPRVIVAVGKVAFTALCPEGDFTPGRWGETAGGVPVMPVYHPAYLLRKQKSLGANSTELRAQLRRAMDRAGL